MKKLLSLFFVLGMLVGSAQAQLANYRVPNAGGTNAWGFDYGWAGQIGGNVAFGTTNWDYYTNPNLSVRSATYGAAADGASISYLTLGQTSIAASVGGISAAPYQSSSLGYILAASTPGNDPYRWDNREVEWEHNDSTTGNARYEIVEQNPGNGPQSGVLNIDLIVVLASQVDDVNQVVDSFFTVGDEEVDANGNPTGRETSVTGWYVSGTGTGVGYWQLYIVQEQLNGDPIETWDVTNEESYAVFGARAVNVGDYHNQFSGVSFYLQSGNLNPIDGLGKTNDGFGEGFQEGYNDITSADVSVGTWFQ